MAEARRWLGTPYHHAADVLGVGVDCGMSLVRWFVDVGLVAPFDPRPYPGDWMMHRDEERYLDVVRRLARHEYDPRERPPPAGDVVVLQHGRTFSHGMLVTGDPHTGRMGWPWVIHAYADAGLVEQVDVTGTPMLRRGSAERPLRAFSYWPEPA